MELFSGKIILCWGEQIFKSTGKITMSQFSEDIPFPLLRLKIPPVLAICFSKSPRAFCENVNVHTRELFAHIEVCCMENDDVVIIEDCLIVLCIDSFGKQLLKIVKFRTLHS